MGFPKTADKYRQFVLLVGKLSPRQLHMAHALVCKPIGDAPTRAWFSGFAASASECDCIRARSPRPQKIDNGTKNDGVSLNLGDSNLRSGSSRTGLLFLPPRIGNQKFVVVEQSIDLRPESREFPLMQGADRYRWLLWMPSSAIGKVQKCHSTRTSTTSNMTSRLRVLSTKSPGSA